MGACLGVVAGGAAATFRGEPPHPLDSTLLLWPGLEVDRYRLPELRVLPFANERLEYLLSELALRARCEREKGVFLWSGSPSQTMRCWDDSCVRKEEGCLSQDIIFEVDPETDDFYRSEGYR